MRPYPLNQYFRSQAVLSEELREQLYTQIVEYRHDLPAVAASFGVDVRRVAAVVRLKTIEKRWQDEVSGNYFLYMAHHAALMITFKNSISLEDIHMVTKFALRASLILQLYPILSQTTITRLCTR